MKDIINNIRKNIPSEIKGFSIKKTQKIYIPYMEIGVECLVQNVSEINLFFEVILKLLEIGICSTKGISKALGVDENIVKEAVSDMAVKDYIRTSGKILKISCKGHEVLSTRKLVEMKKQNITNIMIDLITGKICDGTDNKFKRIDKYDICLNEEICIDKSFLDLNYDSINKVFQEQQDYNDKFYNNSNVKKELYKIVDIYYKKLVYLENEVYIYESDISDEIQLQFKLDYQDEYKNCLYKQLTQGTYPSLDRFFVNKSKNQESSNYKIDQKLKNSTKKVREMLYSNVNIDKINDLWISEKRYFVIDKEFINYFIYSDKLCFDKIIIYTNRVQNILTEQISDEIIRISKRKNIIFIYDKDEFGALSIVNKFLRQRIKDEKNLIIIESNNITDTFIFFTPLLSLKIEENFMKAFNRIISYNVGIIEFNDKSNIILDKIIKDYKINDIISEKYKKDKENMKYKTSKRKKKK